MCTRSHFIITTLLSPLERSPRNVNRIMVCRDAQVPLCRVQLVRRGPNSLRLSHVNIIKLRSSFFTLICEEEGHFHFPTVVRRSHVIREDEMMSAAAVVKLLY